MMNQQEPQITQENPMAYAAWLRSRGVPAPQIYEMVRQRFGPGQTPQQRQEEAASAQQNAGLAEAGGMVGGALVAGEAMRGFQNIKGVFGAGKATPQTPKIISVKRQTATVELPTGGTQQVPVDATNDPGFWSAVDWGQVAQGGLALAQLYGAYKAYQSGDKTGAAITGAAGAGNLAASGALGSSAAGGASSALGGYLIPGLNLAAGLYGGYQTAEALGDMAAGSKRTQTGIVGGATSGAAIGGAIGTLVPIPGVGTGIGAAIGAVVGGLAGAVGSWTGSSKGKAQMARDQIRGVLQSGGVLDDKFQGTLADGSKYDFGKDGSTLKWKEIDKIASENKPAWEAAVPLTDALAASYGFVGQKASDISAWYAKGAVSNAKNDPAVAIANAQHLAKQQGITYDMIKGKLDEAIKDNRISQGQYNYYLSGAQQLTGGSPTPTPAPIQRPGKGQVARVSPGMYMNDQGRVSRAGGMRQALEQNYGKSKGGSKRK